MNTILEKRAYAITRSFKELGNYSLTKEIIKYLIKKGKIDPSKPIQNARSAIIDYFLTDGLKYNIHLPIFLKKEGKIILKQEKLFDSFVLSKTIAGFLRGIDQYPAGLLMSEHRFEQFSVFCHYTSIYQLINSFLALHGICFISKPISGQIVEKVKSKYVGKRKIFKTSFKFFETKCLVCNYKTGKWSFVSCNFSHKIRWKRFAEILKKYIENGWSNQIPTGVKRYYGYLQVMEKYREHSWEHRNIEYPIEFKNKDEFKKFLRISWQIIPKIRNEAIYQNISYDIAERVHLKKGTSPEELIKGRLDILRKFNEAMIEWVYFNLHNNLNKIREILKNDSFYFKCLEDITSNPIIEISDPDLKRIKESVELDKINKRIKEFIPLILPSSRLEL